MPDATKPVAKKPVEQKPRRRWLQYSLRGLLLLTLLAACGAWWLSQEIEKAKREQQAIDKLVEMPGVTIHFSYQLDAQGELTQPQLPTPADHPWLRSWFGDAFVDDPTHLLLAPPFTFDKENVAPLRDLPSLQVIYSQAPFRSYEPGAAAVFGELPALREMRLKGGVNWSEEDIAAWGKLTNLELLEFEGNASWGDPSTSRTYVTKQR